MHPAIAAGRVAVITGAASGIGRAAAERLAGLGMHLVLADHDAEALEGVAGALRAVAVPLDVKDPAALQRLHDRAYEAYGEVALLMNNAGRSGKGNLLGGQDVKAILDVNLGGVLYGVRCFAPSMIAQRTPSLIVNTGSKQGITLPPGNTAYNVSKAAVRALTESLAHELREVPGCQVTAHLLIPGFTFTGMTTIDQARDGLAPAATKPDAAWTAEQVVDFMLDGLAKGDFYILCPDNAVPRRLDERRILWGAADIVANRPALSRWHPDYKAAFEHFIAQ